MTSARIIRFMFKTRNELKFKITEKPGLSRVQDRLTDHRNKIRKIAVDPTEGDIVWATQPVEVWAYTEI